MSLLDEFKSANEVEPKEDYQVRKTPRVHKARRCPFRDEKLICKISRDFVEKGLRGEVFVCTCSEFYVNCDIYKTYWRSGGENEIE